MEKPEPLNKQQKQMLPMIYGLVQSGTRASVLAMVTTGYALIGAYGIWG